jgi:Thrombospondin type 3 repeat
MKKEYRQLTVGFSIVLGITLLTGAQVSLSTSNSTVTTTPAPANPKQKTACMMPTPIPSATTPTPTPNLSIQREPPGVIEREISSVIWVLKISDSDCDGISDYEDNCVLVPNPKQKDKNKNGIGDVCEKKPKTHKKTTSGKQKSKTE